MTRQTLYLHIGAHKTATTHLQHVFANNRDRLAMAGLHYPKAGAIHCAHHALAWEYRDPALAHEPLDALPQWAAMIAEVQQTAATRVLLSSEDFEWLPGLARLGALSTRFDVRVVFFLRSPDGYVESYYQQLVKDYGTRETRTLDAFMAASALHFLETARILQTWEKVFGPNSIVLRLYDRAQKGRGVLAEMMDAIGTALPDGLEKPGGAVDQKASMAPDTLDYMRLLNRHLERREGHHQLGTQLVRLARARPEAFQQTRAGLLSLADKQGLRQRFAAANRAVCRKYLGEDANPFPPEEAVAHADFESRAPEIDAAGMARVAAHLRNLNAGKS